MAMVIIGGGPAGLMAAERLSAAGRKVAVYEAMPTVGRKFMLAGKSGLNLTHDEDYELFATRFGAANATLRPALDAFSPKALRDFAAELGSETFVGSSGRVFPKHMKASPMLRALLRRLDARGVEFHVRHRWTGWTDDGKLRFSTPDGETHVQATATLLALGGASWPRLGSDGSWVSLLADKGVAITPLKPANCGFDVDWSPVFAEKNAGLPLKTLVATVGDISLPGECVVTRSGLEGSLVYAHAAALRDRLERGEAATIHFDLLPGRSTDRSTADLRRQDAKQSFSNRLRKATGLDGVKAGLVRECLDEATRADPARLAAGLKALPITVTATRPIAEAISSAGGIRLDAIGPDYQLKALPGVFAAGEMLDWEAPTGGYLLTACFATGAAAADGMMAATA